MNDHDTDWPSLPLEHWQDSYSTLHLWSQIVGKVRLTQTPWINHSWHVPFYVSARGLTTSAIPYRRKTFQIDFDFIDHQLTVLASDGRHEQFSLEPMSVADFYEKTMSSLARLGLNVTIYPKPVEIPDPIMSFDEDTKLAAYDKESVTRFWRILTQVNRVFTVFRSRFHGKVSPVHFFWGAFDLAVTRFSGRTAPKHPGGMPNCADWVMEEAYSHEVSSAGFWPGAGLGEAAFYAYAYPAPEGFEDYPIKPEAAYFHADLGEFILPYDVVRNAADPDSVLMDFLQTTYEAAAVLANWDREKLECDFTSLNR